jgi:hypothetical protein
MIAEEATTEEYLRGGNVRPAVWWRVRLVDHMGRVVSVGLGPTHAGARKDAWECLPEKRRPA